MSLDRSVRTRLFTALVLLLVLGSGFVMGMALDRQLLEGGLTGGEALGSGGRGPGSENRRREPPPPDSANRGRPLLVEQVGLSEEQKTRVDSIVAFYQDRMRTLHEEFDEAYSTRYREILAETRDSLRRVLTDQQRAAYDSILVAYDRRMEERRQRDSLGSGRPSNRPRP